MNEDRMKEINQMIRKKSMFEFWLGAAGVLFGLLMLFLPLRSLFRYMSAKTDVFEVNADDLSHDIWYKCENNILLGNYADDEDGAFYVTTTGDNQFMGFYVPKASVEKADRIMEAGWTYLDGDTQDWPDEYLTGAGYVRWMTDKEKSYFKAWFDGADDETMSMLSYQTFYLCTPAQALFEREVYIILVIVGGFLFLLSLIKVIVFVTGGYKSKFKKELKEYGVTYEMLSADMANAKEYPDQSIGQKYTLFFGSSTLLIIHEQLVWVYMRVTTTRNRGMIPYTTKTYEIICVDRNNRTKQMVAHSEAEAQEMIEEIAKRVPYIYTGFSDELASMQRNHFSDMVANVDEEKRRMGENSGF